MYDKFLAFGAGFDWISPLAGYIQDFRNRPAIRYSVPASCGWHAYAIRNLLKGAGIKLWGLALYQDTYVFSVRKAQAGYAQYLLERSGIPYSGGIETDHAAARESDKAHQPVASRRKDEANGWLDHLGDLIDSI